MRFIGITGGIGAGKSLILSYVNEQYHSIVLLADDIAKELMAPGTPLNRSLQEQFAGLDVFDADGNIQSAEMADVIFSDEARRQQMNALVHPAVKEEILRRRDAHFDADYVFVEAALLIEDHYDEICDELWYIYASEDTRRGRLKASRGYTDAKIDAILREQLTDEEFRAHCDVVIDNDGDTAQTYAQIDAALGMGEEKMQQQDETKDVVFGLDIGTRNLVGTVGYPTDHGFHVIAQYSSEHQTRAMLDGQIHDIGRVAEKIRAVREVLEQQSGMRLEEVCIAAAGRVLQTITTRISYEYEEETVVTGEDLHTLDLLGIDKAQTELKEHGDQKYKYYCVGYSVMKYYLNGEIFSSLEGHKANVIEEDIIVTFLPEDVVDGLYSAVERADLKVANLTLEPIAAINVAIPENFRMLNIALVDVGAGTSDICITRDGSIIAYGMIPIAGDEVTEVIVQEYLVDFATAEQIKLDSTTEKTVEYEDIMGIHHEVSAEKVWELVAPVVDRMTTEVASKIKELNGDKSVSAAFVVGGGGKVHGYTEALAKKLDIVPERVALRGEEVMKDITFEQKEIKKDPLLVTPIGICLNYYEQKNNFVMVHFNDEMLKLYDNGHLTVVDAAMQAGFSTDELFPRRGREIHYTVNGTPRMTRGIEGESAVIRMNDVSVGLNTPLEPNCYIEVIPSTTGEGAHFTVEQLDEYGSDAVGFIVNGRHIVCPKFVEVNGNLESGNYEIQDGDAIETRSFYTVGQLVEFMDVAVDMDYEILVNNRPATLDTLIYENFSIDWTVQEFGVAESVPVSGGENEDGEDKNVENEGENSSDGAIDDTADVATKGENPTTQITLIINGETILMTGKKDYIFVDIFNVIDFDIHAVAGRSVVTKINGEPCGYSDPLHDGDTVDVYWEE